ncbi:hypothetical protein HNP81_002734 [Peribacillus huizhouensis]|uniref:Uncharacterized protein n=1 Tax=Peribacillus huizhouensis TaxID=1501239 RepID=A0ABR6CR63_9BACI|nr:hypothetical protein [Peribacillus huizhouensis]
MCDINAEILSIFEKHVRIQKGFNIVKDIIFNWVKIYVYYDKIVDKIMGIYTVLPLTWIGALCIEE